jgi:hypothetical protein
MDAHNRQTREMLGRLMFDQFWWRCHQLTKPAPSLSVYRLPCEDGQESVVRPRYRVRAWTRQGWTEEWISSFLTDLYVVYSDGLTYQSAHNIHLPLTNPRDGDVVVLVIEEQLGGLMSLDLGSNGIQVTGFYYETMAPQSCRVQHAVFANSRSTGA